MKAIKQSFLLTILLALSIIPNGCSDNDVPSAISASDYTLLIIDAETQLPRCNEPVAIVSFGTDDKIAYKRTYVTDNDGKAILKLDQGKYQAEFAFMKGKNVDNFKYFEVQPNTTEEIIMPILDKRDYYECTLTVVDIETGDTRQTEPVTFITLDDNNNEIATRELMTNTEGKIAFRVVAGKYRTSFAYEVGEDPDNTYDFEITPEGEKNLVMNVKPNTLDDRKPIGFIYFEDDFSWIGIDFGGTDYMDGNYPTGEKRFTAITDPDLLEKMNNSGWTITGAIYARIGYIKYGLGNNTGVSNGMITTSRLPIEKDRFANISIAFKAARFIGKTGALDTENIVTVVIEGDGSFSKNEEIKSMTLPINNAAYNEWDRLETVVYNASSSTEVSIGKEKKLSKGRFFLDDVVISKHSKAEIN